VKITKRTISIFKITKKNIFKVVSCSNLLAFENDMTLNKVFKTKNNIVIAKNKL